jgi:hypothetical protein
MTKHTPGPWKHNDKRHCIESTTDWLIPPDDPSDLEPIPTDVVCLYGAMGGNDTKADARLIAAAPELLEALQGLFAQCAMVHRYWGDNGNAKQADDAIKAARAAIAKATE